MKINELVNNRYLTLGNEKNTIGQSEEKGGLSFLDTLKEKLDGVNEKQIGAEELTEGLIKGEDVEIHDVMIASEEAKLSLQLAVQVRNKLVEAYQELSRMQL